MAKIDDYDFEKMFQEQLNETMQENYAQMLKVSDPLQYEIGLNEFTNEIMYNLEQKEIKESAKQNWTQIDFVIYGNEEAIFKEYDIIFYIKKKDEIITDDSIAEKIISFETEKEAMEFFKYAKKTMNSISSKIKNKEWYEKVSAQREVSDIVEKNWEKLEIIFDEGIVPAPKKKKIRTI